jgi:diaminopimelate decarboxylase
MWWSISNSLEVKGHALYIGGLNAREVAEKYGTPLYVTDRKRVKENYTRLFKNIQQHLKRRLDIHYSIKANSNIALLKMLKRLGASVDATSPFEVLTAEKTGFSRDQIICTGTSFSDEDMIAVEDKAVMNIDSISQLKRYANLVQIRGFNNDISIRVNPGKGAGHCPDCVTAGEDAFPT